MAGALHFQDRLARFDAMLSEGEKRLLAGLARIERQAEIVAELEAAGGDPGPAREHLDGLQRAQHDLVKREEILLRLVHGFALDVRLVSASEIAVFKSRMLLTNGTSAKEKAN